MKWLLLVFLFWCTEINAQESNFTFTYQMATRCKEFRAFSGYSYDTYYNVRQDLRQPSPGAKHGGNFEMHLAIQASSNGHILLSPVKFPDHDDPVYEIVVGGGGNKFTELRRNLKRNAKTAKRTDHILSAVELRGFYINISSSGMIEFGQEGSTLPLLSFFDKNPLDIEYFSFAAWNGVEAKFLYDCPPPGEIDSNITSAYVKDSIAIKRNLSASEQLKQDKLQDRPPHMPPGPSVPVSVEAKISSVTYNAFEAKLTTRMTVLTQWKDEGLAWNPDKFKGLMNVTYRQGQIWRPMLHVYNADDLNALTTTGNELISFESDGTGLFHFKSTVNTWCFFETDSYNNWPRDDYSCTIVIQAWEPHEMFTLSLLEDDASILDELVDVDDLVENEWKLTSLRQSVMSNKMWNIIYPMQSNTTHQSDRLVIRLTLERRPNNYNIGFYTPLIVLMTFVLISFWNEPIQMSRVRFYAGAAVFISAGLCFIDYLIPCHTIPSILVLYIVVLDTVLVALILQVVMMTSAAERVCKSAVVQNVLSARWFRALFCLPVYKICRNYNRVNDGYSQQEDDLVSEVFSHNGTVEEMDAEANPYCEKQEVALVLDKTMFVVYSVLFAAMLAAHY